MGIQRNRKTWCCIPCICTCNTCPERTSGIRYLWTLSLIHIFDDAVEQAVWLEHGNRHSAHIHSKNIDNITKYAKEIDTAILVKNAPSYAALGFGGEGYCTFTIASRTGEGLTCASTFTKRRRCVMADSLCIR